MRQKLSRTQYACGCQIQEVTHPTKPSVTDVIIKYCPKHNAAPTMYEALQAWDKYVSAPFPENMKLKKSAVELTDKALAQAERKL